jgi:hypothetical protein
MRSVQVAEGNRAESDGARAKGEEHGVSECEGLAGIDTLYGSKSAVLSLGEAHR